MTLVPRPSEAAAAADQLGGVWGCGASPGKVFLGTKLTRIWDILRDDLSAGVCGTMPTSTTDSVRGDDVKVGPKSARSQANVGLKSAQSQPEVGPKFAQSRSKVSPQSAQSRFKAKDGLKSAQSQPEVGPKLAQPHHKVGPRLA